MDLIELPDSVAVDHKIDPWIEAAFRHHRKSLLDGSLVKMANPISIHRVDEVDPCVNRTPQRHS